MHVRCGGSCSLWHGWWGLLRPGERERRGRVHCVIGIARQAGCYARHAAVNLGGANGHAACGAALAAVQPYEEAKQEEHHDPSGDAGSNGGSVGG